MRTLYIECNMGAAGDMLMAALLELHPHPDAFIERMNHLGIPGVHILRESAVKCGITGTHISVKIGGEEEISHDVSAGHSHHDHEHDHNHGHEHGHHHGHGEHEHSHAHTHNAERHHDHDHGHEHGHHHGHGEHEHTHNAEHHHAGMSEINAIIAALPVSKRVKSDMQVVYSLIAEAESKAHGKPVEAVHFHEVGMMDAVADIAGVAILIEELNPQRIVVSPVHVGSGQVKCAHGILPVPAPATAHILRGIPTYGGQIQGELCTPTGAALLKHFATEFGERPVMTTEEIGYGMGKKDFPAANCVRVFIGESEGQQTDIVEIVCNLDDMTGEEMGFALEVLMENGALDVYMVPIQMKKSRPGQMLVCLCNAEDEEKMAKLILRHTTTFGVRSSTWRRHKLERSIESIETAYGPVRVKTGSGFGVIKSKAEYEDLATLAKKNDSSILEIKRHIISK